MKEFELNDEQKFSSSVLEPRNYNVILNEPSSIGSVYLLKSLIRTFNLDESQSLSFINDAKKNGSSVLGFWSKDVAETLAICANQRIKISYEKDKLAFPGNVFEFSPFPSEDI